MVQELRIEKDLEGSGRGLMAALPEFVWMD
jgi:hypothetical protein